jgi:hypothetical protein
MILVEFERHSTITRNDISTATLSTGEFDTSTIPHENSHAIYLSDSFAVEESVIDNTSTRNINPINEPACGRENRRLC